jgi:hypothetical protein
MILGTLLSCAGIAIFFFCLYEAFKRASIPTLLVGLAAAVLLFALATSSFQGAETHAAARHSKTAASR